MAAISGSPLEDIITCSLCYEIFNHAEKAPKGLPCMHTYCLECLETFVSKNLDFQLKCPLCQGTFTIPEGGVKALPNNLAVKHLLDNLPDVQSAGDLSQMKIGSGATCNVHKKGDCEFMCKTCLLPLCSECIVGITKGPHSNHIIEKADNVLTSMMQEFEQLEPKVENLEAEFNHAYENIKQKFEDCKDDTIANTEQRADKLITEIVEWKNNTVKKITCACEEATINLNQQKADLQPIKADINRKIKDIKRCFDSVDAKNARIKLDDLKKTLENFEAGIPHSHQITFGHLSESYTVDVGEFTVASPLVTYGESEYVITYVFYISHDVKHPHIN